MNYWYQCQSFEDFHFHLTQKKYLHFQVLQWFFCENIKKAKTNNNVIMEIMIFLCFIMVNPPLYIIIHDSDIFFKKKTTFVVVLLNYMVFVDKHNNLTSSQISNKHENAILPEFHHEYHHSNNSFWASH